MEEGGKIMCFSCWEARHSKTCAGCGQKMQPGETFVGACGKHYHRDCFVCAKCKAPLPGTFREEGGEPVCGHCVGNCVGGMPRGTRFPHRGYGENDSSSGVGMTVGGAAQPPPPPPPESSSSSSYAFSSAPPRRGEAAARPGRRVRRTSATAGLRCCVVAGCDRPQMRSKGGYCASHVQQEYYSRGEPSPPPPPPPAAAAPYDGGYDGDHYAGDYCRPVGASAAGPSAAGPSAAAGSRGTSRGSGPQQQQQQQQQQRRGECFGCRRPLGYNVEFTVIEVDGVERCFHKDCFRCTNCEVAIGRTGSQRHMVQDGRVYCVGCWQSHFDKRCAGCHSGVRPGETFLLALGRYWHRSCFACHRCRAPLAASGGAEGFFEDAGRPCCERCIGATAAGVPSRGFSRQNNQSEGVGAALSTPSYGSMRP